MDLKNILNSSPNIPKLGVRVQEATGEELQELRNEDTSFVAMAISKAGAVWGNASSVKGKELCNYINMANMRDLNINDIHDKRTSVEWAAYHGMIDVLVILLERGCSLVNPIFNTNAISSAIKNGQHKSMEIIFQMRKIDAKKAVLAEEKQVEASNVSFFSSFFEIIQSEDVASAKILIDNGCAYMSDRVGRKTSKTHGKQNVNKLKSFLSKMYPEGGEVDTQRQENPTDWWETVKWSFPKTDREMIVILIGLNRKGHFFDEPVMMHVISFMDRGWFAGRLMRDWDHLAFLSEIGII